MPSSARAQRILWVDNDPGQINSFVEALRDEGYHVFVAASITEAKKVVESTSDLDLVILDMMIPLHGDAEFDEFGKEANGGLSTGVALARWFRRTHRDLRLAGLSVRMDEEVASWFETYGAGYASKYHTRSIPKFLRFVQRALGQRVPVPIRALIVHGHDEHVKWSLKNFLQNRLGLPEPIVLHEQPSHGKTLIEKFEEHAADADVVFVLMTPDDEVVNEPERRARQNVVFELGYFLGVLGRRGGRVIILHKGRTAFPSDIAGLSYINIDGGVEAAAEEIRHELRAALGAAVDVGRLV
jgi:CheY-like chemotaxis protein